MNQKHGARFNWQKILGALAAFSGTIGAIECLPVVAASSPTQAIVNHSLEQSTQLNLTSLDRGAAQIIARHHHHGRRHSRGFKKKKFGFNRRHRSRSHGHRPTYGRRNHRRSHFRGFKYF